MTKKNKKYIKRKKCKNTWFPRDPLWSPLWRIGASGFATFIILDSDLLKEFGIVASINIICIFILSLLIIPIIYSFMPLPKTKHLKHLNKKWVDIFVGWMERMVRNNRIAVYIVSIIALVLSIIGIYQIEITGSRVEDLPKNTHFLCKKSSVCF